MILPEPQKAFREEISLVLNHLHGLLANLPEELPSSEDSPGLVSQVSQYEKFKSFSLNPQLLERTGDEVATLGEQLESIFGWTARTSGDGVIVISERGWPLSARPGPRCGLLLLSRQLLRSLIGIGKLFFALLRVPRSKFTFFTII